MAKHTLRAKSLLQAGLSVENTSRGFRVIADEPVTMRGTDTGMNPMELLLCALGSCQCITARIFARSQGIDLKDFRVEIEGDLDTDGFIKGKDGVRPGFQEIRIVVFIKADAPQEKIEHFIDFVKKRCPVSDNLTGGVRVVENHVIEP